ncbi:ferritin-like domain-containing protein [Fuchsiella alkaliacetigena]|uniref:ferritin-like domain-containing protein n=1 Tax=Fuchsiella alkaliacetigena TaxID=957042 RepID=UPI00200B1AA5|nr:ferritin family protein [Fuchsiella alkaliacetigena]MCK8823758.1 rubrerythrin family protein [Fuchsiella alkaliacetigena]
MDLINENELGVTKGTELEGAVNQEFKGETTEVGLYLAMARQAQREGLAEVAEVLKTLAWEEAEHAARFAELNGKISEDTKENIEKMMKGEQMANKGKRQAAVEAKEEGLDAAHDVLDESSKDEARHARALKGLLERYF